MTFETDLHFASDAMPGLVTVFSKYDNTCQKGTKKVNKPYRNLPVIRALSL